MTSGPLYLRRAQVTCPNCGARMTTRLVPPETPGGTVLTLASCERRCGWMMLGADVRLHPLTYDTAPTDVPFVDFDPDARITLTVKRPEPADHRLESRALALYEWGPTASPPVYLGPDGERFTFGFEGERHIVHEERYTEAYPTPDTFVPRDQFPPPPTDYPIGGPYVDDGGDGLGDSYLL